MYLKHFNLAQEPFSIAPDPSFLYLSEGHREALAHLLYGFSHGGFVLVTGEVGTGKTTLLRNLIKQTPNDLDVAFVLNPRLTVRELLETICDELGVAYRPENQYSVKQYIDKLNKHLLQTHQRDRSTVLIIDEAQNLSPAVLEQLRLLTNLETDERKLLRIILLGQPELGEMLDRQELRQLAQRITARYHLGALSREDTYTYINHRLSRAGGNGQIFTPGALAKLYKISKGIPRLLNVVADRSMLGAYVEGQYQVSASTVDRAAIEVMGKSQKMDYGPWIVGAAAFAILATAVVWALITRSDNLQIPEQAVTQQSLESPQSNNLEAAPSADVSGGTIQRYTLVTLARPQSATPNGRAPDTQRSAYYEVFKRWNADYNDSYSDELPCAFAETVQLGCLQRKGRWSDIARLNLPAVLELWDNQEQPYYAAVVDATATRFILMLNGHELEVAPRDLRDIWFGSFTTLWNQPPEYPGNLRRGDRHATVSHLRQQLAQLPDLGIGDDGSDRFGTELEQAVLRFQTREGLMADGVVGPETWIRLFHRLGQPGPVLRG
jgi:general secretion pathway protein A